jgi:hypothetical protein
LRQDPLIDLFEEAPHEKIPSEFEGYFLCGPIFSLKEVMDINNDMNRTASKTSLELPPCYRNPLLMNQWPFTPHIPLHRSKRFGIIGKFQFEIYLFVWV